MEVRPTKGLKVNCNPTKEAVFEKWIVTLRKNASVSIDEKVLDEIDISQ